MAHPHEELPFMLRALNAQGQIYFNDWRNEEIAAGYCLDAPTAIPAGGHRSVYVPHVSTSPVFGVPTYIPRE